MNCISFCSLCTIIQDLKSKVPKTAQLISHSKQQEILDPSGLFTLISNAFAATNNTILNPDWLSWVSGLYNCDQAKSHSYQIALIAGLGWQCNSLINSQRHDLRTRRTSGTDTDTPFQLKNVNLAKGDDITSRSYLIPFWVYLYTIWQTCVDLTKGIMDGPLYNCVYLTISLVLKVCQRHHSFQNETVS